jgi:outer membrane receptor protein involved in Fe transport
MVSSIRKLPAFIIAFIGLLVLVPMVAFAGTTGRIKGNLTDKDTGEPIIGASVQIVGTKIGAQTDLDGNYLIPRVDPGTYTLRISSVEYQTVEITDVEVQADLTTEQDQKLQKKVEELKEVITVRGTRDIIERFETSSQVSISQESIKHRPVQQVDDLLEQVAGVKTTSTGEVFIRGGRAGEVRYIVDGVPIGDPLGGLGQSGANLSLVSGSIQEIQIIKDGFDPEYGDALSGIVNIRNQTGSKDVTKINLQYMTDDLGNSALNDYSRNYDYMRFSVSGPDPILKNRVLPALGLNFLEDKEFTYYLFAEMTKYDGLYQYSRYDTPVTRRSWPSFNLLGFNVPERLFNKYALQANFRLRPTQNVKAVLSFKKWITQQTGFDWQYRYSSATAPVYDRDESSISLEVVQTLSKDMYYEAILSVYNFSLDRKPGDPNNPGQGLEPDDFYLNNEWESWSDTNGNGVYDAPEPLINLFPDTASYGTNFTGPLYTKGEFVDVNGNGVWDTPNDNNPNDVDDLPLFITNVQGGGAEVPNFRFNNNGVYDLLEGEPFVDLNGNGVWDRGEFLTDVNGNGKLDQHRLSPINGRDPEPYTDGDSIIGEPFNDLNVNGVYDVGIDVFVISVDPRTNQDLNHNGKYDGPGDPWEPGVPFLDRNGNGIYDLPNSQYDYGEPYRDINGNNKYDRGGTSNFLNPLQQDEDATWQRRKVRTYRGEIKLYRTIGNHELKGGFAVSRDEVTFEDIERPYLPYTGRPDGGAYSTRGAFRDFYEYNPWKGTAYFRDKLEYGSMIASLGLRWDYFLQDVSELESVLRADDRGGLIEGDRHKLSPRIGFSYPISDKAKVYFNYGHFFQLPLYIRMYARNTSSVNQNDVLGNPNLDYQKTIQYSFGVKYAMSESYSVDIQGYFKDEFDKINQTRVREGSVYRNQYRNSDYGRSRGIELTLEKRGGGYVNGQVSYTYAFAFGKASKTDDFFLSDFLLSRQPLSEHPLDYDIRHSLKSAIQVYMPTTVKPRLFGVPIPNGWSLAVESVIESGRPFTPAADYPDIVTEGTEDIEQNSLRLPATAVFDVRFTKEFSLVSMDWQFIVWVENLFDNRNVLYVYPATGRPDTDQNNNQVVFGGTDYSDNPSHWDYGRQIRLGLELNL